MLYMLFTCCKEDGLHLDDRYFKDVKSIFGWTKNRAQSILFEMCRSGLISLSHDGASVTIAPKGCERYEQFLRQLDEMILEPDVHNIPSPASMSKVLDGIGDVKDRVLLMELISAGVSIDVTRFFEISRMRGVEPLRLFECAKLEPWDIDTSSLYEALLDHTLYGPNPKKRGDVTAELVRADLDLKSGRFVQARETYDRLISRRDPNRSVIILSRIGLAHIERLSGNVDVGIDMINSLIDDMNNNAQNTYLNMVLGIFLMQSGRGDEGASKIKGASKIFKRMGYSALQAHCNTLLGYHYFNVNKVKDAEYYFSKALSECSEAKCLYLRYYIMVNMADVFILKNELEKANAILKDAIDYFEGIGDLYGLSGTYFNMALYHLAAGNREKALEDMASSISMAYPLPGPYLRKRWKEVFAERAKGYGIDVSTERFLH